MCRFCERANQITKSLTVLKYEKNAPKMDGIFQRVEIGRTITKETPTMQLVTNKTTYRFPLPLKFNYCPSCGRKIGEEKK